MGHGDDVGRSPAGTGVHVGQAWRVAAPARKSDDLHWSLQGLKLANSDRKSYSLRMIDQAAVLTGDLIASTEAGQVATDTAIALIESVAIAEGTWQDCDVRFTRFRGDGWQLFSSDPTRVFRLAVLILANLQSRPDLPKTRISAATGQVSFLPEIGLASASGQVFSTSGRNLDSMGRQRLIFETDGQGRLWRTAFFTYLEWQSSRWSPEQAESIALTFRFDSPQPGKSAEKLGISRQAFSARLDGAGYVPLWEAERAYRQEQRASHD
jgi:hypothetical protein